MGLAVWGSLRVTGGVLQAARTNVANRIARYRRALSAPMRLGKSKSIVDVLYGSGDGTTFQEIVTSSLGTSFSTRNKV